MLKYQLQAVAGTRGGGHQEKDIWVQESTQHLQLFGQQVGGTPLRLERDSGALPASCAETQAPSRQLGQLGWNFIKSHLPGRYPRSHYCHLKQLPSMWYSGIIQYIFTSSTRYFMGEEMFQDMDMVKVVSSDSSDITLLPETRQASPTTVHRLYNYTKTSYFTRTG